jgi:hypothetical protein
LQFSVPSSFTPTNIEPKGTFTGYSALLQIGWPSSMPTMKFPVPPIVSSLGATHAAGAWYSYDPQIFRRSSSGLKHSSLMALQSSLTMNFASWIKSRIKSGSTLARTAPPTIAFLIDVIYPFQDCDISVQSFLMDGERGLDLLTFARREFHPG